MALLATIFALSFSSASQAQLTANPYGVDPEHYQCYTISQPSTFQPRGVTLRDQFGFRQAGVLRPAYLCTPVSKNNGLLADRVSHLVCYITSTGPAINKRVEVFNQFGRLQFTVQRAFQLCVPSLKRVLPTTP
jgi:hypothetical protein